MRSLPLRVLLALGLLTASSAGPSLLGQVPAKSPTSNPAPKASRNPPTPAPGTAPNPPPLTTAPIPELLLPLPTEVPPSRPQTPPTGSASIAPASAGPARNTAAPIPIDLRKDLPYADSDNPRQTLDLYLPSQRNEKPLPLIVFIHGGGWKAGNKASGAAHLTRLVQTGQFAGASIAYRLSLEAKWPAQIHDCKAAIRWLKANAPRFNLDPERIAVWGSSAGGHLASLIGTSGDVPELEGTLGTHRQQNSRVRCVVNFYGPQNFVSLVAQESSVDRTTKDYPEALLLGGRVQDVPELAKAASPVSYASPDDASFFTAHGTQDPLVPRAQAREINEALKKNGVESVLIEMTDAGHGFRSPELDSRIDRFLAKHLLGKPAEIPIQPIAKGQ
jgi:acetyl esterase/lipase